MTIPQNPSDPNSIPIIRSINEDNGIEFTYSVWIYVSKIDNNSMTLYKNIFNKGSSGIDKSQQPNILGPNNAPGLYITPKFDGLYIVMSTFNAPFAETMTINDLPINKWVNIIIRVEDTTLDVYINGRLAQRKMLMGVPKQNYGPVNVAMNGGFPGSISGLRYFNYGLGTREIQDLVSSGPNLKQIGQKSGTTADYLSLRWFFDQY